MEITILAQGFSQETEKTQGSLSQKAHDKKTVESRLKLSQFTKAITVEFHKG
jgi:hypothetical protein